MKGLAKPYRIEAREYSTFDEANEWAEQESYRTGRSVYIWYAPKRTVTEVNVKWKRREIAERYGLTWVENPHFG